MPNIKCLVGYLKDFVYLLGLGMSARVTEWARWQLQPTGLKPWQGASLQVSDREQQLGLGERKRKQDRSWDPRMNRDL